MEKQDENSSIRTSTTFWLDLSLSLSNDESWYIISVGDQVHHDVKVMIGLESQHGSLANNGDVTENGNKEEGSNDGPLSHATVETDRGGGEVTNSANSRPSSQVQPDEPQHSFLNTKDSELCYND